MVPNSVKAVGVIGLSRKNPRREATFEATILDNVVDWCWSTARGGGGSGGGWGGIARIAGASGADQ